MDRKLRPPILGTEGILGILAICIFFFLHLLSFKLAMGFGALICLITSTITMIILIRTRNMYFISMFLGQFLGMVLLTLVAFLDIKEYLYLLLPLAGFMGISFTVMIIWSVQRKMKWRTREMLELAAQPIEDNTNGLTQRPMKAGTINASPEEIKEFARFIRENLIAIPVVETGRIVFIINIPMSRLLRFSRSYENRSWVAFTFDGTVTVNILQEDYYMYKDLLAFDQLCQSLGDLFINFFEQYRGGEESRIIYQLNALNLNIITEG
jgi:hypothetical protein